MKGRERSMAIRSGINKQGWEQSDFPVACDKCYGENPYMRMLKEDYGQECRLCFRPFTVFKWKGNRGIYKRTCVCQGCSKDKNICQVCTLDMEFGLPIQVRDKRCGTNGKYLLDQNFTSSDNNKIRPLPPPGPPPSLKDNPSEKELIFIPERESDEESEQKVEKIAPTEAVAQKKAIGSDENSSKVAKNADQAQEHEQVEASSEKEKEKEKQKEQQQ